MLNYRCLVVKVAKTSSQTLTSSFYKSPLEAARCRRVCRSLLITYNQLCVLACVGGVATGGAPPSRTQTRRQSADRGRRAKTTPRRLAYRGQGSAAVARRHARPPSLLMALLQRIDHNLSQNMLHIIAD
ncbi:jg4173 [Pararge aegeria aegeria]|uniref:Jg4173 protein n=1 Tax=Pararge aegeria aegeria TaxID=348720 RepID=A0A8S4SCN4_9NEOP|nr:jg4173 [Pararge aegeria aegeria]